MIYVNIIYIICTCTCSSKHITNNALTFISPASYSADEIRKRAWPQLLGVHYLWLEEPDGNEYEWRDEDDLNSVGSLDEVNSLLGDEDEDNEDDYVACALTDARQIELDVTRCTWHLLTGNQRSMRMQMEHKRHKRIARVIRRKQRRLAHLINRTLTASYKRSEKLSYYQGYHDIACIFLATMGGTSRGMTMPSECLYQISQFQLRDPMQRNFLPLQTAIRLTLFPLLAYFDREVHDALYACDMEPFFALSWIITWFAHDVRDTEAVKRLFDAFIISHPMMPLYGAIAMMSHPVNRQEILRAPQEFSAMHQVLTDLPKNSSMWGWKYRPGDGYVSDDDDDSVSSASSCNTTGASIDGDLLVMELEQEGDFITREDIQDATSVSTCLSSMDFGNTIKVPFQLLLDKAIEYMHQIPPRDLLLLADRYHGAEAVHEMLDKVSPGLSCLKSETPSWVTADTAKADWLLKQWRRERQGRSSTNRRDRLRGWQNSSPKRTDDIPTSIMTTASRVDPTSKAWIATGLGPSGREENRRKLKQKKRKTIALVATVLVLSLLGLLSLASTVPASSLADREMDEPLYVCEIAPASWEYLWTSFD
jgi:TBC1 domain family member 20